VARRRTLARPRVEPPEWYRNFHPENWDVPDGHELRMMDGCLGLCGRAWPGEPDWPDAGRWSRHSCWPQFLHDQHAERRWGLAKYAYEREHPDLAEQELADIRARRAVRRDLPARSSD
jgi:hypothetical protein